MVNAISHYDEENDTTYYTADKSFDEVASFIENGGIPVLIVDEGNRIVQCEYFIRNSADDIDEIGFKHIILGIGSITFQSYSYFADNSIQNYIEYSEISYGGSGGGGVPVSPVG